MEILIGLCILLFLMGGILLFIVLKGQKKINIYEALMNSIYDDLVETIASINEIDQEGIFESDDEVGFKFRSIKKIINNLKKYLIVEELEE